MDSIKDRKTPCPPGGPEAYRSVSYILDYPLSPWDLTYTWNDLATKELVQIIQIFYHGLDCFVERC